MFIKLLRSYPKLSDGHQKLDAKGNPVIVFVYRVTGSKEELAEYERIQNEGEHTCKDDGGYLWFTTRPVGLKGRLCISQNDKIYADTTAMDLAGSLIKQYPGQLGSMLAKEVLAEGHVAEIATEPVEQPDDKL